MGDYDLLLDLANIICSLCVPLRYLKLVLDEDREIAIIIRCQKSIQYLRKTKTEGYIDYDSKLEEIFRTLDTDLRYKLKKARQKRKQSSSWTVYPMRTPMNSDNYDSNESNDVDSDITQSIDANFDFISSMDGFDY